MPRTVSVVINTYNRAQSLESTLRALRQLDPVDLEVVVVNGPSTDGTKEVLDRWDRWVKVGHCPERNLSMSRNIGIAMAAGDVVAFIDDDAYPDPAWLRHILDGFEDPEVAGVGGPTLDHTGVTLQARYNLADRLGNAWVSTDADAPNPTALFNAPIIDTFLYTLGTNSAFRRDRLIEIGGFDEEYEYYLDETDVCLRLIERGYVITALDAGTVFHKFLPSAMRTPQRAVRDRFPVIKNRVYFGLTHGLETHSFDDLCRSLVTFLDLSRGDVVSNLHHGLLEPADLERFDADTHTATTLGFESWKRGHRRRPCGWFDEQAEAWLSFPSDAPLDGARLHLCLVSQEYPPNRVNGIGRLTHSLATGFAALGHVVRVITRGDDDRVDLEDGVWVHRLVDRDHPLPPD
ncbi:MAG: glycosyltransferase, partial [Actinobacteria bacterium]|nr:glycosyltransferase [Actinomycetota bacterium]